MILPKKHWSSRGVVGCLTELGREGEQAGGEDGQDGATAVSR